jgi:tRNA uridine 5-carboxymethylaminomethyl modification enzyme
LRHDNADRRLTRLGHAAGLVSSDRLRRLDSKEQSIGIAMRALDTARIENVNGIKYLKRSDVGWAEISALVTELRSCSSDVADQVLWDVKYEGYVARQEVQVERQRRLSEKRIPNNFDYQRITGLRIEAKQKLTKVRPASLDQASRISGITPADLALVLAHIENPRAKE